MPFIVRQQSAFTKLDETNHRMITVITPIRAKACETLDEARAEAYLGFSESNAESHYAVISENSRYVTRIKIGSQIDGFRQPGELKRVD
jgi:hypothetical protein